MAGRRYQVEKQNPEEDTWAVHKDDLTKVQADTVCATLAEVYENQTWRVTPHGSLVEPDPTPTPEVLRIRNGGRDLEAEPDTWVEPDDDETTPEPE